MYCGQEGAACQLKAAVVCSNPFDLELSIKSLQTSFIGKELYLRSMANIMKAQIETHKEEIEQFTDLDIAKIRRSKYLYEFDEAVQLQTTL
ncbi:hypothetical protein K4F52_004123 [Lecanicillium sp. MT-2017a]|nr:hypothetical protein K4F52_004123 [Lecanicillium sp. MT-2017a]